MDINLIVCYDSNYGIGKDNKIPWTNKEDMALFKQITTECQNDKLNAVIMGRKTFQSLNKALPNRINCVLTKNKENFESNKGFYFFSDMEECFKYLNNQPIEKIFLIGGTEVYNWGLENYNQINYIYTSQLNETYECDTFFNFKLLENRFNQKSVETISNFKFTIWEKKQNLEELSYLNMLDNILKYGHMRQTRNAITYSLFGKTLEFDLSKSFPLLTTKKMFLRGIFEELKFFLLGQTNNQILKDKNVHIWDGNTTTEFIEKCNLPYKENDLGPMYGYQWRFFNAEYTDCNTNYSGKGYDQLMDVIHLIKTDPFSRRILLTSYNPAQAKQGVLYPCHGISIQFYVEEKDNNYYLNCLMNQRSGDTFLGIPFNIASYALLVHILCNHINNTNGINGKYINPGRLMMVFCDVHIYEQHKEAVMTQISRTPYLFPQIKINYNIQNFNENGDNSIGNMNFNTIEILNYKSYDSIKALMIA
jgi:dihydrofolate reductase/thymidylate synthase